MDCAACSSSSTKRTLLLIQVKVNNRQRLVNRALTAAQLASSNRKLSLEFLNSSNVAQYEFVLSGLDQKFSILSDADTAGQDMSHSGFASDATFFFVGKISGNGTSE